MSGRFLKMPRLRVWHLLALVAAIAGYLAVFRFRGDVYTPLSRELRQARYATGEERRKAVAALGSASVDRQEVLPALLEALEDTDPEVRRLAAQSVGRFAAGLKQDDREAAGVEEARQRLLRLLRADDPELRVRSALALVELEELTEPVCDVLVQAAQQKGLKARRDAVLGLSEIGFRDDRAIPVLLATMRDPDPELRTVAIYALCMMRPGNGQEIPDEAVQAIIAALDDEAPRVREAAAGAVPALGRRARAAVPGLLRLLDETPSDRRVRAIMALRTLRESAEPALPALRNVARRDPNKWVRDEAEGAVQQVETASKKFRGELLPALIAELAHDDPRRRKGAAQELGSYGWMARDAVPGLKRQLSDADPGVQSAARAALREVEAPEPAGSPEEATSRP